jgi:hypothetical protein
MANSVYKINKGINQPIEFKGLKAQFIWYLGGGLVGLLLLYAVMYFLQVNTYISLVVIAAAATTLFTWVYKMSNTYGEHGIMKKVARRAVPGVLKLRSRKLFTRLTK